MAAMEEFSRLIKERIGAKAFQEAVFSLPDDKRREVIAKLQRLEEIRARDKSLISFESFVQEMWPDSLPGPHFEELAKVFHRIDEGEPVRMIICLPPRFGKSERLSYLFPAWYIGKHPEHQIIQASNVKSLAETFGGKIRNLMNSELYKKIFPGVTLAADSAAKGHWNTNKGGRYFSVGAGGTVVGRGANLLIIDDPHSEQSIVGHGAASRMPTKQDFEKVYNWFTSIRGRLEPGASVLLVMQRWAMYDLVGRLMDDMKMHTGGDRWEIVELPALLEKTDDNDMPTFDGNGQPEYISLWPQRWPVAELLKLKESLPSWKWNAQYMQNPKSDEAAIIKREFWRYWGQEFDKEGKEIDGKIDTTLKPPRCDYVIQSWDTAITANNRSNYSACVTIGIFKIRNSIGREIDPKEKERDIYNVIVLNAKRGRYEFQDLKKHALEQYKAMAPDTVLVEAKASGPQLVSELRRMGIPAVDYTPTNRSGDKVARVTVIADIFASRYVWIPAKDWAEPLIEEYAMFPNGEFDDLVDAMTQALARFRSGGFISTKLDEQEEEDGEYAGRERKYY